jgi:hypothetical protein
MKTVFNNDMVCHVWAQQTQNEGRNGNGSLFFEGKTIYSYGYHFPMATFITDNIVLMNSSTYSVTTTQHQGLAKRALHSGVTVFEVPNLHNLDKNSHIENIKYMINKGIDAIKKASRARSEWSINSNKRLAVKMLENSTLYAKQFKLSCKRLIKPLQTFLNVDLQEVKAVDKKVREAEQKRLARVSKDKVKKWLSGEFNGNLYAINTIYLRLSKDGETVETSHGAKVPLREAILLFKAWKNGKNIHGIKIGYFTVTNANSKIVKIGCHNLKAKQINEFFKELEK